MLVATTLAVWATSGELSGFSSAHQQLPLLVSAAFKELVLPIELCACTTQFPAMLRDLGTRSAWSDASKRPSVLIGRFPCALNSLPALDELLAGEAEVTKFDTACVWWAGCSRRSPTAPLANAARASSGFRAAMA